MRLRNFLIVLVFVSAFVGAGTSAHEEMQMKLELGRPTFVLPQFSGPYMEREATIAPEEVEQAENLKALLDNDNRDEVLQSLAEYYDLELSPAMLMLKAQLYFSLEMLEQAEATYLAVLKRKPQLIRAHADLGQLYLVQERTELAQKHLARAIALGSNEAVIHGQLAYLNLANNGAFSAISEYQQAMALEPNNAQWQRGLLAALTQARMYEAANALLREMLEKNDSDKSLWLGQAAIALQLEERKRALLSMEMALLLGENAPSNLKTAAKLHLQLQSYDRAFELIEQSFDGAGIDMRLIGEYVHWLEVSGLPKKASQLLARVEPQVGELDLSGQSKFFLHKGNLAVRQGKIHEAIRAFDKSLQMDPTNGATLIAVARQKAVQSKYSEAELLYSRAKAIDNVEKKALLGLSQMYLEMKDYQSALQSLKSVALKFPEVVEAQENIEAIQRIIKAKSNSI